MPRITDRRPSRSAVALAAAVLATLATLGTACAGSGDEDAGAEALRRVGLMHVGTDHVPSSRDALIGQLEKLGWVEGRNVHVIWRNLEDKDAAQVQADVFVRSGVDVIVAFEDGSIKAAEAAAVDSHTPIVFLHPNDPVRAELVESLASPGTNLTGVFGARDLIAKHLELYTRLYPGLERVLTLVDPEDASTEFALAETRRAAKRLGVELVVQEASEGDDIRRIFRALGPKDVDAVVLLSPSLRLYFSALTLRLAKKAGLPVQAHRKEWVEQGALFSYGMDLKPLGVAGARYVDEILDGADPSELAVEELPEVEFALNLATARRLGIHVPRRMIVRADITYGG